MKKLVRLKVIRVLAVILSAFQGATPLMAADSIQMINNQPVAVVPVEAIAQTNPTPPSKPTNVSNSFEAGPLSATMGISVVSLPAGYTVAKSNANFAILIQNGISVRVRNLVTNSETIFTVPANANYADISSDGSTLVAGQKASSSPAVVGYTIIQNLANSSLKTSLEGASDYSFTAYGEVVLKTFSFPVLTYRLDTLQRVSIAHAGEDQYGILNSPSNTYQIKDELATGVIRIAKPGNNLGSLALSLNLDESPVVNFLLTDHRLYYVTGNTIPAKIKYVELDQLVFSRTNYDVPESAKKTLVIPNIVMGDRRSIEFVGTGGLAKITDAVGVVHSIQLDIQQEWKTASSNANFAFSVVDERVGSNSKDTLKLMNLTTGQIQDIATRMSPYGGFANIYDVSPDGKYVVYDMEGPIYPKPVSHVTHIKSLINSGEEATIDQQLGSVQFQNGKAVLKLLKEYDGGLKVSTIRTVELASLAISSVVDYQLEASGATTYQFASPKILAQGIVSPMGLASVVIFDTSAGTAHMKLLREVPLTSNSSINFIGMSAYQTPSGKKVLSVGLSAISNATFIIDVSTGATLVLDDYNGGVGGAMQRASYQGELAKYTVTSPKDGTKKEITVDLKKWAVNQVDEYDALSKLARSQMFTYDENGKKIKITTIIYKAGTIRSKSEKEYEADETTLKKSVTSNYSVNGKIISSEESRYDQNGKVFARFLSEYDEKQKLARYVMFSYQADPLGVMHLTAENEYFYAASGLMTAAYISYYDGDSDKKTRMFVYTYHSNGKVRTTSDYRYDADVLMESYQWTYGTNGALLTYGSYAYYTSGGIRTADIYNYGTKTHCVYLYAADGKTINSKCTK